MRITSGDVVFAALLLFAPCPVAAQAGRQQVEEGNRLYREGLFRDAYQKYLEALRESPESGLIRFNEGNALFQSEELERATEAYRAAIESDDPGLASAAWYNLGNAFYRQQQLQESIEAYKQSLRANPADVDAKHNLERALTQLREQQQNQEQNPQNQDQQDEQEQDEDQQNRDQQNRDRPEDQEQSRDQQNPGEQSPRENPESEPPEDEDQQPDEPQRAPGEMSREEAERLLQAVQEDPGDVNRKKAQPARGRRPRKKW